MSKRLPTAEEKRLWKESNTFTKKKVVHDDEDVVDATPAALTVKKAPSAVEKKRVVVRGDKPALNPLPPREAKKQRTLHSKVQATLDLHGCSKIQAHEQVQHFIARHHAAGRRHVVIITGKGRIGEGVLRQELPHWLNDKPLRPMVGSLFYAPDREGGNGVMHILLKSPAKQK